MLSGKGSRDNELNLNELKALILWAEASRSAWRKRALEAESKLDKVKRSLSNAMRYLGEDVSVVDDPEELAELLLKSLRKFSESVWRRGARFRYSRGSKPPRPRGGTWGSLFTE